MDDSAPFHPGSGRRRVAVTLKCPALKINAVSAQSGVPSPMPAPAGDPAVVVESGPVVYDDAAAEDEDEEEEEAACVSAMDLMGSNGGSAPCSDPGHVTWSLFLMNHPEGRDSPPHFNEASKNLVNTSRVTSLILEVGSKVRVALGDGRLPGGGRLTPPLCLQITAVTEIMTTASRSLLWIIVPV